MMNATERQLRKIALILTGIVVLQVLWSGLRIWQTSEPAPVMPAASSLQVDRVLYDRDISGDSPQAMVSRPLFWPGRHVYIPDPVGNLEAPVVTRGSAVINQIKLRGLYPGGAIISYNGKGSRVLLGEAAEDWKLIELLPEAAVFSSGTSKRTLTLEHASSVASPRAQASAAERSPALEG
ncbi:MAG: hypothetical protein P8J79_07300 [Halioglobus sp.]|nr:hypothetical protein [Halioglobus sp.]